MSIETWKEEFYPVRADSNKAQRSWMSAVKHSLQKWKGLRAENLKRHGVYSPPIDVYAGTCSLCQKSYKYYGSLKCEACPLFRHLGRSCDDSESPFITFLYDGGVEPMIKALEKTQRKLRSGVLRMDLPYNEFLKWKPVYGKEKINEKSF